MKNLRYLIVLFVLLTSFSATRMFSQDTSPLIRFGLIADIQYGDCDTHGDRYYRNSLEKLTSCIDSLNEEKVQFTINLGDIVDRSPADIDPVVDLLKKLDAPVYHTTGNHDYKGFTNNGDLFNKLDMPAEYYSFKKGDWLFIMLNTNEIASYSNIKGTWKEAELPVHCFELVACFIHASILLPFRPSQQVAAGEIDTDFIQQDFIGPVMRQGKPERQVL